MPIDYNRYPPNWKTEIVPHVLKRAGNCCEFCGLENGREVYAISMTVKDEGRYKHRRMWFRDKMDAKRESITGVVDTVKVVLTVAHLDHDEENHNVKYDRLAALCQVCHLRYDAAEKYRRRLESWKIKEEA